MSDIDFDELDRAVASVLGGSADEAKPATPAVTPAPVAPVEAQQTTPAPAPQPTSVSVSESIPVSVVTPSVQVPVEPPVSPTPAPTEIAPKPVAVSAQDLHATPIKPVQRGRFMDMIHPSTDTVRSTPVPAPAPVAPAVNQTFVSDVVAPQAAPAAAPLTPVTPLTQPTSAPTEPVVDATDFFAPPEADKTPDAPASPFIPDAKVEKRPLGAWSVPEAYSGGSNSAFPEGDELHDKLVQVESEDNIIETAESPIPTTPITPPLSKREEKKAAAAAASAAKAAIANAAVTAPIEAAPVTATTPAVPAADPSLDHHFSLFDHDEEQPTPKKVKAPKPPKQPKAPKQPKLPKAASSYDLKAPKYGRATWIWVTVAIAVMLIGFGVGATLYFVVLR